jgi:hypothetical protein
MPDGKCDIFLSNFRREKATYPKIGKDKFTGGE